MTSLVVHRLPHALGVQVITERDNSARGELPAAWGSYGAAIRCRAIDLFGPIGGCNEEDIEVLKVEGISDSPQGVINVLVVLCSSEALFISEAVGRGDIGHTVKLIQQGHYLQFELAERNLSVQICRLVFERLVKLRGGLAEAVGWGIDEVNKDETGTKAAN